MTLEVQILKTLTCFVVGIVSALIAIAIYVIVEEVALKLNYRVWRWLHNNQTLLLIALTIAIYSTIYFTLLT